MDVTIFNKGIPGQNSTQGRERFPKDVISLQPHFVFIFFGTNDALNEDRFVDLARFLENLSWMIEEARRNKINPVLCTIHHCIPSALLQRHKAEVYGDEGPNGKIDRYNAAIREQAFQKKVPLADFSALTEKLDTNWISSDGVHLTSLGYQLLAEAFWGTVKEKIKNGDIIVCLGDSLTYGGGMQGEGTVDGSTYPGWVKRLAASKNTKADE